MKKHFCLSLLSFLFLYSCSFLEQKDFMETKVISTTGNEKIIYKYYQMGTNDYNVEFYAVHYADTTKLFRHSVNEAMVNANSYTISENNDEVIISTKLFPEVKKVVTGSGRSIILTNK